MIKKIKNKIISTLSILIIFVVVLSCKKSSEEIKTDVYIIQSRNAYYLAAIKYGIIDEIKFQNVNANVETYVLENSNLSIYEIAKKINDKKAIIIALGDDVLNTVTDTFPTNPIISSGILESKSLELLNTTRRQNGNITGVYYVPNIELYVSLILKIIDINRIGYIEYKGFKYSNALKDRLKIASTLNNIKYINYEINDILDIKNELKLKHNIVDALIVINNVPVNSVYQFTIKEAYKYSIPVISFQPITSYDEPILLSISPNYYRMGRMAANMIIRLLAGDNIDKLDTQDMRINSELDIIVNGDIANKFNVKLREDAINMIATKVIENGKMRSIVR